MSSNINTVIRKLEFLVGKELGSNHYKRKVLRNQLPKWTSDLLRNERNWVKTKSDLLRNERNWVIGKEEGEANLILQQAPSPPSSAIKTLHLHQSCNQNSILKFNLLSRCATEVYSYLNTMQSTCIITR